MRYAAEIFSPSSKWEKEIQDTLLLRLYNSYHPIQTTNNPTSVIFIPPEKRRRHTTKAYAFLTMICSRQFAKRLATSSRSSEWNVLRI